jgi:predicted nucleic acid-binding protein
LPAQKRKRPRGVVDTSVLVAGIAGLKSLVITPKNPSAKLLRDWIEGNTFVWLVSDEILLEYKRDVKTAMQYQHPELEIVRVIINDRNARHKTEFLQ